MMSLNSHAHPSPFNRVLSSLRNCAIYREVFAHIQKGGFLAVQRLTESVCFLCFTEAWDFDNVDFTPFIQSASLKNPCCRKPHGNRRIGAPTRVGFSHQMLLCFGVRKISETV